MKSTFLKLKLYMILEKLNIPHGNIYGYLVCCFIMVSIQWINVIFHSVIDLTRRLRQLITTMDHI